MKKIWNFIYDILGYLRDGWNAGLLENYLKALGSYTGYHLNNLRGNLAEIRGRHPKHFDKLQKSVSGLHTLLPRSSMYSYSILISLNEPNHKLFERCLRSVLRQTAPEFEVLIGYRNSPSEAVKRVLETIKAEYPGRVRESDLSCRRLSQQAVYDHLVKEAKGNFILIIEDEDWLRPDMLYRYEQVLHFVEDPENIVVLCDENKISASGHILANSHVKRNAPHFPYFFKDVFWLRGCLIPLKQWAESTELGLILGLAARGVKFISIPLSLYSRRDGAASPKANPEAIEDLRVYTSSMNLDWEWKEGLQQGIFRALPQIRNGHRVQVIIPYKDQRELTIRCVKALLQQRGVEFVITAVDNGSIDTSIADEIRGMGGEVLTIREPFNFSRLNNLAVERSKLGKNCDLILFLNNDVDLAEGALMEMVRWIDQPGIGIVGCRLHYPDGRLQHGGVEIDYYRNPGMMTWHHVEKFKAYEEMIQTRELGIVDAVTAACCLVKRKDFMAVGGFDEIWYPIAYSDTNLVVRLGRKGLKAFYTPYASGVHHESVSRKTGIEDFENLTWLHEQLYAR